MKWINLPNSYLTKFVLLCLVAFFLAARCFYLYLDDANRFPIEKITVQAPFHYVARNQIEDILMKTAKGSYFTLPMRHIHEQLSRISAIKKVQVARCWPYCLSIHLEEKKAIAKWHHAYLTADNELFNIDNSHIRLELPILVGSEHNRQKILQCYQELSPKLKKNQLIVNQLSFDTTQGWQLSLKNDMLIAMGNQQIARRLSQFLHHLPSLAAQADYPIAYADLRYPRGVAIKYKQTDDFHDPSHG